MSREVDQNIRKLIRDTIEKIIIKSSSPENLKKMDFKHQDKIHFIPKKYRILSGILQSMNIQFGNFLELLIKNLILNDGRYEILEISGNKNNTFKISMENEKLIDEYITKCQSEYLNIGNEFENLKKILFYNECNSQSFITLKHDIDLLFKDKSNNKIYYIEIKYNDDYDTGKFIDINRKFIKTYTYLINKLKVRDCNDIVPILYFFNNKKLKGNIYIPEETNIMRGSKFFEKFLRLSYKEIDDYLLNISEDIEIIKMFDDLYIKIMNL